MADSKSTKSSNELKKLQLLVFTTMFIGYACYGYTRKGVSLALPKLMEEGLRKEHAGLIISCQNIAYAISKFLGGILSDTLSARRLFSTGLLAAGIATILFGTVDSLGLFCTFWFLNGFAQGCGWPSCAKIIRQWYHPSQFGTWWSVLSASTNVSGGIAPFISTFIILSYGWRYSLFVAGGISVILGILSLFTLFNSPADLGYPSFLDNPKKNDEKTKTPKIPPGGIKDVLASPFTWLVSFAYCVTFLVKTAAVDWGQVYMMEDLKQSVYVGSTFASCIESGGFFGGIAAGMLTDAAVQRHNKQLHYSPRMPAAAVFSLLITVCLHVLVSFFDETTPAVYIASIGFLLGACCFGNIALFGIMACECSPIHLSGSSHAIAALAGNIGAIISGLPLSMISAKFGWSFAFFSLELLNGLTAITLLVFLRSDSRIAKHLHQD